MFSAVRDSGGGKYSVIPLYYYSQVSPQGIDILPEKWMFIFHYNISAIVHFMSYRISWMAALMLCPVVLYCTVPCFAVLCALWIASSWTVPCFGLKVALPCLADRFPGRTLRLWLFSDVLRPHQQQRSPLDHVPSFNARLVFLSRSFLGAFNKKKT